MCGSGTLPIEGALMAADIAPGLRRRYFGFLRWKGHHAAAWSFLIHEANERRQEGLKRLPPILGCDIDASAVRIARANVERADLTGFVRIERRALGTCEPSGDGRPGLVVVNPPYGERLGTLKELESLYAKLGEVLKVQFQGWRAAVFTGNPELGKRMGLRARRYYTLYNGAIECRVLNFEVEPRWYVHHPAPTPKPLTTAISEEQPLGPGAEMFANRLRKNLKTLGRWARREGITCYRLYDADLPEYAVALDVYEQWAHVQEYEAPATVDPTKAQERLREALAVMPEVLAIPPEHVFLKVRRRQKGFAQYEKIDDRGVFHEVREGPCRFLVNFTNYLDTGLFLDHRPTRALIQRLAEGRDFLNLFGYTGTATVCAALGGARSTTTVDMSKTYLDWAERNLALNGFHGSEHRLVQAGCLEWIKKTEHRRYGLIFLDPPTFSTSKRMQATFDVQRDHVELIKETVGLLEPDGILLFSNNYRRFKMDLEGLSKLDVEDITRATIPRDFERNPRIHHCWKITPNRPS
jgi:23S rRNA (guanine2445-N2)-methyltransferase / 23S rRNA (guanine2069-N7)-methyltransferase